MDDRVFSQHNLSKSITTASNCLLSFGYTLLVCLYTILKVRWLGSHFLYSDHSSHIGSPCKLAASSLNYESDPPWAFQRLVPARTTVTVRTWLSYGEECSFINGRGGIFASFSVPIHKRYDGGKPSGAGNTGRNIIRMRNPDEAQVGMGRAAMMCQAYPASRVNPVRIAPLKGLASARQP
jgi:hypothetical protein